MAEGSARVQRDSGLWRSASNFFTLLLVLFAVCLLSATSATADPVGLQWPQPSGRGTAVRDHLQLQQPPGWLVLLDAAGGLPRGNRGSAEALGLYAPLDFIEVPDAGPAVADLPYATASSDPQIRIGHHVSADLAHAYIRAARDSRGTSTSPRECRGRLATATGTSSKRSRTNSDTRSASHTNSTNRRSSNPSFRPPVCGSRDIVLVPCGHWRNSEHLRRRLWLHATARSHPSPPPACWWGSGTALCRARYRRTHAARRGRVSESAALAALVTGIGRASLAGRRLRRTRPR